MKRRVLAELRVELATLWDEVMANPAQSLEPLEGQVRDGMRALGTRLLGAALAGRGTGKAESLPVCACGGTTFAGYRGKDVRTVVGWVTVRRAYYTGAGCRQGHCPLDTTLGLSRDSLTPGVRRLASRCGALLPFAEAATTLAATAHPALRQHPAHRH